MKPLEGVTVIELSSYFAVPGAGRMLASQGARVIKVEPPRGDIQRYFAMAFNVPCKPDENPLFDTINGGKEFVSLDLKDPAEHGEAAQDDRTGRRVPDQQPHQGAAEDGPGLRFS